MNEKGNGIVFKKRTLALSISASLLLGLPAFSQMTPLSDLEAYHNARHLTREPGKQFDTSHWAYQSLEHLSKKYGLLLGDENDKFAGDQPLSRNEAAVILVNLIGKIEKDNAQPTPIEKSQIEIMKNEFSSELTMLTGRIEKLEDDNSRTFKAGIGYNHKISGAIQAQYTGNYFGKGAASKPSNFSIPVADVTVQGTLREHLDYTIRMFPSRTFNSSNALMSDVFLVTDIVPEHKIYLGQLRKPIGYEGSLSPYTLETVSRAQISRNFSDKRDKGITIKAFRGLFDYMAGVYNGTPENANDTANSDLEYALLAMINPLHNIDGYGKLKLGGTYNHGKRDYSTDIYGYFGEYNLGKYMLRAEWGKMNGYLDRNSDASGFYVHNSYFLTDDLQLLARYDNFDMDIHSGKNRITEYTLGANYYFNKHKMKVMCDFVYAHNKMGADSRRLEVLSQFLF